MEKLHKKKKIDEEEYDLQPNKFDGWLIKFILYDKHKYLRESEEFLDFGYEPYSIYSVPTIIIDLNKKYKGKIETGFFGFRQDSKTLAVKPVIGYKVYCFEDKEKIILKGKKSSGSNSNKPKISRAKKELVSLIKAYEDAGKISDYEGEDDDEDDYN